MYRDRNKFPYQAYFEIPFGNSYTSPTTNAASDTVLYSPVSYLWAGGYGYTGTTGSYDDTLQHWSEGTFKYGTTDALPLLHQTFTSDTRPKTYITPSHTVYLPELNLFITIPGGDAYTGYPDVLPLVSYTPNVDYLLGAPPTILAPYNNFYLGCGIANVNTNQTRLILSYSPGKASITTNTAFDNVSVGDRYVIYDPSNSNSQLIYIKSIDAFAHPIVNLPNAYTDYYIIDESLSYGNSIVSRKIIAYDYTTQLATIDSPFPSGWKSTDVYSIRQNLPSEVWTVQDAVTQGNDIIVSLPVEASEIDNFYKNYFLYTLPLKRGVYSTLISGTGSNDFYYISGYTGASRAATVQPMGPISNPLALYSTVNIASFRMNNEVPLLYSGSIVSQQEDVLYDVSIANISYPNVNMSTGPRLVQYPYVFVCLESVSSSSGGRNNNIIYSNNPNSRRAIFLLSTTNTTPPEITPFLRTDSGGTSVIIRIKPNDSLRFSMFLPNGELYKTQELDSSPPYQANLLLQITCTFALRKL